MDLSKAYDHPVQVLRKYLESVNRAEAFSAELKKLSAQDACQVLEAYEKEHDVTFAALDNETLAALKEAYWRDADPDFDESLSERRRMDIENAIDRLLGLEDF